METGIIDAAMLSVNSSILDVLLLFKVNFCISISSSFNSTVL